MAYDYYSYRNQRRKRRYLIRQIRQLCFMVITIIILIGVLLIGGYIAKTSVDPATMMDNGVPKNQINSFGGSSYSYGIENFGN